MKIVTAIDSFKGSMTSMEAGLAVTEGIHRVGVRVPRGALSNVNITEMR